MSVIRNLYNMRCIADFIRLPNLILLIHDKALLLVMLLILTFVSGCNYKRESKKNKLSTIIQHVVFIAYCKSENDVADEPGVQFNKTPHIINFILLNDKSRISCQLDSNIELEIKKGLAQCRLDTSRMKNYKISYQDDFIIDKPIEFHLCNGELYAKIIPARPGISFTDSSSILLSKPFKINNRLDVLYYKMTFQKSALNGFVVIEDLDSENSKIILDRKMYLYN